MESGVVWSEWGTSRLDAFLMTGQWSPLSKPCARQSATKICECNNISDVNIKHAKGPRVYVTIPEVCQEHIALIIQFTHVIVGSREEQP